MTQHGQSRKDTLTSSKATGHAHKQNTTSENRSIEVCTVEKEKQMHILSTLTGYFSVFQMHVDVSK
jgi:hypothetical protein